MTPIAIKPVLDTQNKRRETRTNWTSIFSDNRDRLLFNDSERFFLQKKFLDSAVVGKREQDVAIQHGGFDSGIAGYYLY